MSISDESVRDFIRVYKEEFGDELSVDQGREMLARLVVLYELLSRPLPDEGCQRQDVVENGDIGETSTG
jgi:hypothetical protein